MCRGGTAARKKVKGHNIDFTSFVEVAWIVEENDLLSEQNNSMVLVQLTLNYTVLAQIVAFSFYPQLYKKKLFLPCYFSFSLCTNFSYTDGY